ncbi:glycosyltransferase [Flavobacterium sp.]|uniref:glycosyltransferase n=1 Tax=Flavobacterium sp. TaxID=239 RepID=UPI001B7BC2C9|nr:glycosyltransferase [Flavobacterium sp.]MBP6182584.1 glycosyltransferase [Flavobacterium sp.]
MARSIKNILFVSNVCDDILFNFILENSIIKPSQAAQKFQKLFIEGFLLNNTSITAISTLPVDKKTIKRKWFNIKNSISNGVEYYYLPILNLLFLKEIIIFTSTFLYYLKWMLTKKDKIVINNILNLTVSITSLLLSKLFKIKCIAIVTDLPIYMGEDILVDSFKMRLYKKLASYFILKYDGYILLTEQMNEIVNVNNKPFLVMEGLVDYNINKTSNKTNNFKREFKIIYAGSIHRKYGILNLINAFIKLKNKEINLHIYGNGDLEKEVEYISKNNPNIKYFGTIANELLINELKNAYLLINPRPISGEYTKYSFPSKNIEYMSSGTPLVTTNLPGIPKEYYPYIYILEGDKEIDIFNMLYKLINLPISEIEEFGKKSKKFVQDHKSNKYQTERVLKLLNNI